MLLRAGALPAKLTIVEERTVGPGLGADSIAAGKLALLIGTILVAAFMIASYGLLGVLAVVAVIINVGLIFGVLSVLGATLTLPGIAGILLTIGMAVDSNVIIYERIREEARLGPDGDFVPQRGLRARARDHPRRQLHDPARRPGSCSSSAPARCAGLP